MTGDGPKIVIEGTPEDWPGGPRTLTPRDPSREPNRQTFWTQGHAAAARVKRGTGSVWPAILATGLRPRQVARVWAASTP